MTPSESHVTDLKLLPTIFFSSTKYFTPLQSKRKSPPSGPNSRASPDQICRANLQPDIPTTHLTTNALIWGACWRGLGSFLWLFIWAYFGKSMDTYRWHEESCTVIQYSWLQIIFYLISCDAMHLLGSTRIDPISLSFLLLIKQKTMPSKVDDPSPPAVGITDDDPGSPPPAAAILVLR